MRAVKAGAFYFLIVFAAGWLFGPVRVLLVEPRVGPTLAVLIEAPFMLTAMVLAARFVVGRTSVGPALAARAVMGLTALALLLAAEALVAGPLRGQSPGQYMQSYLTPEGAVSLAMFLIFAAVPSLVARAG
jgi:hypothetical protein